MGKSAKRKQTAAMNEMNQMVQAQVEEFKAKQQVAETKAAETRILNLQIHMKTWKTVLKI